MYFWTCWYTKRFRLTIYVTLAIAITFLGILPEAFVYQYGHWRLAEMTAERVAGIWAVGAERVLIIQLVALLFAAADLGALALGEDSKRRELDFLLTRPRPRHYFVWSSWLAGLGGLMGLLILPVLTSMITLFYLTQAVQWGALLRLGGLIFAMAAAMYALVFLLATLTGNALNGLQLGGFVIFLFVAANYAQNELWFLRDYRPKYYGAFNWFDTPHQIFPFANLVIMICVTLALPLITQAGFKRRDV